MKPNNVSRSSLKAKDLSDNAVKIGVLDGFL